MHVLRLLLLRLDSLQRSVCVQARTHTSFGHRLRIFAHDNHTMCNRIWRRSKVGTELHGRPTINVTDANNFVSGGCVADIRVG
jgi:hypothetical protein